MQDRRGNPVGTASANALDAAEQAMWRMMSFYGTPGGDLDAALAADPAWALPTLMKAGFLLSLTEPSVLADARTLLASVQARHTKLIDRERRHLQALQTLVAGDWLGACKAWEALLLQQPRDVLALHWAHLFDFYRGDATNLRQRVARVLPEWDAGDPLHPFVLGLYAFGLEENQLYAEAEATGRQALAEAKVPWAMHAVAHVMEMQGRHEDGSAWLQRWHADWALGNGFAGHLGWHHALFALERLDHAAALHIFDEHLAADPAQITLQRIDAAALLWRVQLLGGPVGERWQQLVAGWPLPEGVAGHYPFNDLHALLALLGSGEVGRAEAWLNQALQQAVQQAMQQTPQPNECAASGQRALANEVAREVALPLMRGLLAFARGDFDGAVHHLSPVRAIMHRVGGSHAQRDLIDQTLIAAATRSREPAVARALLNERRLAKPITPLTAHWLSRLPARIDLKGERSHAHP